MWDFLGPGRGKLHMHFGSEQCRAQIRRAHQRVRPMAATYGQLGNGYVPQAPSRAAGAAATAPLAASPQSRLFASPATSPFGSWDQLPAGMSSPEEEPDPDFDEMVSDLRRSFVGWLKKAELELKQHRSDIRRGRQAFEEEKLSVWQQFMAEKQRE
ncbi:unnamed protein product, partial [Effrenium voratum]